MVKNFIKSVLVVTLCGMFVAGPLTGQASAETMRDCHDKIYSQKRWRQNKKRAEECVRVIQQALNEGRLLYKKHKNTNISKWHHLEVDGKFGPKTEKAVIAYQTLRKKDGLRQVDGIVGKDTWWHLSEDCLRIWPGWKHFSASCKTPALSSPANNRATIN